MESTAAGAAQDRRDVVVVAPLELVTTSTASDKGEVVAPAACSVFKEVLEDPSSPIPTMNELETFGLFDLSESERLLAEYRLAHPSPIPSPAPQEAISRTRTRERPLRQSSDPQNRYSLTALQLPPYWPTSSPLASPSDSPRLNPFAFVRKSGARPRLSQRTKSATEAPSSATVYDFPDSGDYAYAYPAQRGLARDATLKVDKRSAVRKLRKAPPPKITVRTDETSLLRPIEPQDSRSSLSAESAARDSISRSRRMSWASNASSSYPHSPITYDIEDVHVPRTSASLPGPRKECGRSSTSVAAAEHDFAKRREATSSSAESLPYHADNERNRSSPRIARSTRSSFGFASASASSPTSSIPSPSRWVKPWGFDRMRRGGNSSPSSPIAAHPPGAMQGGTDLPTFEVLSRPSRQPSPERRSSLAMSRTDSRLKGPVAEERSAKGDESRARMGNTEPLTSMPELDSPRTIPEQQPCRRALARGISFDSVVTSSGCTTPAVLSTASSGTIRRPGTAGGVESDVTRSKEISELLLATALTPAAVDVGDHLGPDATFPPRGAEEGEEVLGLSSRAQSAAGSSWTSSSSSRSRDSLSCCSGDETPASSAVETDDAIVRETDDAHHGRDEAESVAHEIGKAAIILGANGAALIATPTVPRLA
ncbi:hypothetical protein JCM3774_003446 [Rhodotorula dairenensis]